jgi:hypothetical protein
MSVSFIQIVSGNYRKNDVSGQVFELVEQFKTGAKGGFVTVKNGGKFPGFSDVIRINVEGPMSYQFVTDADASAPAVTVADPTEVETDEQVMERIRERFDILTEMTKAATNGDIRAMIVSGPPGVGKSFGVEQEIEKACLFDQIAGKRLRAEVVKGSATPIGLYQTLYKYSDANCVVVFDDCDSILLDDVSLNLLKGALDSGKKRKISWLSESSTLRREGIPVSFEFRGSVIFITNLNFSQARGKIAAHVDALQSRCHYLDLTIDTERDKMLRIRQVHRDSTMTGGLFKEYDFEDKQDELIMDFMWDNHTKLREVSLRMALKVADLVKISPTNWRALAESTCMIRER